MSRKEQAIDLVKLFSKDHSLWNEFLTDCQAQHNIKKLTRVYYGLQVGMDDLVKDKPNYGVLNLLCLKQKMTIDEWFLRLQRSIEKTLKNILREKYPNPCDHPLIAKKFAHLLGEKKARDLEFDNFLKRARF